MSGKRRAFARSLSIAPRNDYGLAGGIPAKSRAAVNTPADVGSDDEDLLDRYRQAVERLLGSQLAAAGDDDFEAFFDHVSSCFDRGVDAETCALSWIARRGARGA